MAMMMAAVRDSDGQGTVIVSDYETKTAFRKDLKANGYTVVGRITVKGEKETAKDRRYNRGCRA